MSDDPFEMPDVPPRRMPPWWVCPLVAVGLFCVVFALSGQGAQLTSPYKNNGFIDAVSLALIVGGGIASGLYVACRLYQGWIKRVIGTVAFSILGLLAMTVLVFVGCVITNTSSIR